MMLSAYAHDAVSEVRALPGRDAILVDFNDHNIGLTMTRAEAERLRDALDAALRQTQQEAA
jgi:hypothetical protein